MENPKEQVEFAMELLEFSGINLLDNRNIEQALMQRRTAEIRSGQERARLREETRAALETYFANGGKITHFPPRNAMGHLPIRQTKNF